MLLGNRFTPNQGLKDDFCVADPGDADTDPSRGEEPLGLVEVNCTLGCSPLWDAALCCYGGFSWNYPRLLQIHLEQRGPLETHQWDLSDSRMPVPVLWLLISCDYMF